MRIIVLALSLLFYTVSNAQNFITEWTFPAAQTGISFYTITPAPVNYTWTSTSNPTGGSGSFSNASSLTPVTLSIPIAANDVVRISMEPQNMRYFSFMDGNSYYSSLTADADNLTNVLQWGAVPWTTMHHAFAFATNLNITATDTPDLSRVTDMGGMFSNATSLNGPANINNWDVSNVTDMSYLFNVATIFNQPLDNWNTAKVTTMIGMFSNTGAFNQDINNWNTANVVNMNGMFASTKAFNKPLVSQGDNWNTAKVTDMSAMFSSAEVFNQDISSWNTSMVTRMNGTFAYSGAFNQDISSWNTAT